MRNKETIEQRIERILNEDYRASDIPFMVLLVSMFLFSIIGLFACGFWLIYIPIKALVASKVSVLLQLIPCVLILSLSGVLGVYLVNKADKWL